MTLGAFTPLEQAERHKFVRRLPPTHFSQGLPHGCTFFGAMLGGNFALWWKCLFIVNKFCILLALGLIVITQKRDSRFYLRI